MARRTFFSFHYQRDVHRAHIVRNSWVTQDREDAGFFDSSVFESKQRTSDDALKRFLNEGLVNCSVTCVLIGNQTSERRWVRYEILRSFTEGKGLFGVTIHSIHRFKEGPDFPGLNPFSQLGYEIIDQKLRFKEFDLLNYCWIWSPDVPPIPLSNVRRNLNGQTNVTLDSLFPVYDWNLSNGYANLGSWIEAAARAVGR